MENPGSTSRWVRERIAEIEARRDELYARHETFARAEEDREIPHKTDTARRARELAHRASYFAQHAHARSLKAHAEAARIHDEAAELHERLAQAGIGNGDWHRRRAEEHRLMAADDRRFVEEPIGTVATSVPSPGQETRYDRQ